MRKTARAATLLVALGCIGSAAVALGETAAFDRAFGRLVAGGMPGPVIAGAVLRHLAFLHGARAACDRGESAEQAIARARPPVFRARQAAVRQQLRLWSRPRIERGLEVVGAAVLESRRNPAIADAVIAASLLRIATGIGGGTGAAPRADSS